MRKTGYFLLILFLGLPAHCAPNYSYTVAENTPYNSTTAQHSYVDDFPVEYTVRSKDAVIENSDLIAIQSIPVKKQSVIRQEGNKLIYTPEKQIADKNSVARNILTGLGAAVVACALDPYAIMFNGEVYVMVLDNGNGKWDYKDLFGYKDSKRNIFKSLKKIESDGDKTKISRDELKKANIRLVRLGANEVLELDKPENDLSLDLIEYIDMESLRKVDNPDKEGVFGSFFVYFTYEGQTDLTFGAVTFYNKQALNKLMGK